MSNTKNISDNEIDVLVKIVKKNYRFLLTVMSIGFLLSIVYAKLIHNYTYQATALVQIAKENGKIIENIDSLKIKLLDKYEVYTHNKLPLPKISNIKIYKRGGGIIKLYAEGKDKKSLKEYIQKEIAKLSVNHNRYIDRYILDTNTTLEIAKFNLITSRKKLKDINKKIVSEENILQKNIESNQLIFNNILIKLLRDDRIKEKEEKRVSSYRKQIKKYNTILLSKKTLRTKLVNTVKFDSKPINIGKKMIVIVGTISSILLGFLLILLFAFLRNEDT